MKYGKLWEGGGVGGGEGRRERENKEKKGPGERRVEIRRKLKGRRSVNSRDS